MTPNPGTFSGQVAVITGGASGIGEACARLLAARGAKVVIADLDEARARSVAQDLGGVAVVMDVGSETSIADGAAQALAAAGSADILITSAGITHLPLTAAALPIEDFDRVQEIDLRGTWATAVAFGKTMIERRRGAIVTIASITGLRSVPLHSYAAAKAGVISLTASLAADWGRYGVRVNCISPGFTLTPLLESRFQRKERDPANMIRDAALGRLVRADEVAKAAAFLVSEEASGITGINLPVDCGWLATVSWNTHGMPRSS